MVIHGRPLLLALALLSTALAGSTCKVVNEDHCANQDLPGNQWCLELNTATPYCSPCRREFHGCVDFEPYACPGYDDEIAESGDDGDSETSTGETSTGSGSGSSG